MKTFVVIILPFSLIVFLFRCNQRTTLQEAEIQNPLQLTGSYTFQVTRAAEHPDVQFPSDTLSEDMYELCDVERNYEILFSSDGNRISIQSDSIAGQRSNQSNQYINFDLVKGLFAGGRFLIWLNEELIEAEFTIYGSGVPIIKSERGLLIKKN